MRYNLKDDQELMNATKYFDLLLEQRCMVEIKKIHNKRTLAQNSFTHLLLQMSALAYGEKLEYFKSQIWKKIINPDIFITEYTNRKTGKVRKDLRSSSDLSTAEMAVATTRLQNWMAKELNVVLTDDNMHHAWNHVEKNKEWL